jgi:hypothetical protein
MIQSRSLPVFVVLCLACGGWVQQGGGQDDKILERGDKLLEEAKAAYEEARTRSAVAAFVDAGFKLEEARIKFIVVQEIGSPEKQKLATDRLRAVNQLSKLIHDGKVAVSGAPAEAAPAKPAETPDRPPEKKPAPAKPAVDVTKRAAVPDAAKQREAEKLVKDLFKEHYSKKSPQERKALAKLLLDQAAKSQDDPAAEWVLYREAQDVAVQAGDADLTVESIDLAARVFDVDALAMKTAALGAVAKTTKSPDESWALAEAMMKLVDELVRADQFDPADKLATAALAQARRANDAAFLVRATTRSKEVAEAKSLFQGQKSVLQALARNPDDPGGNLEMGKFVCYVKGSWDLGLRFLVKGSDPGLKSLAEQELSNPTQPSERAALADGWYDLGEKDKSPLRKSQLLAHARATYESALPGATALLRAKIEKRLEGLGPPPSAAAPVDLLKLIDTKRDAVAGEWTTNGRALVCTQKTRCGRVQVPYEPPEEYDVSVVVERKEGFEIYIGLSRGQRQFYVAVDDYKGSMTAIGLIDGKWNKENKEPDAVSRGKILTNDKPSTIVCAVRKDGVSVTIDGQKVVSFKGNFDRLSNADLLRMPNPRALYLGCNDGLCTFSKATLTVVSGQGKVVR